jgi:hypothetical protein
VVTDFQTKVNKYESKAARCKEWARQAEGAQRAFYDVLAQYYGELATDYRQVIEKTEDRLARELRMVDKAAHSSTVPYIWSKSASGSKFHR